MHPRKERKKLYTIGLIIVAGLFIAGLAFFTLFGARFISYIEYRYNDTLYPTPSQRKIEDFGSSKGTVFSTYGYSVRLPWENVLNEINTEHLAGLVFKSGQVFQVHHPAKVVDWHTELNKNENNFIIQKLKKAFGPGCCSHRPGAASSVPGSHTHDRHCRRSGSARSLTRAVKNNCVLMTAAKPAWGGVASRTGGPIVQRSSS